MSKTITRAHDLQVGDILHSSWGYDQTNATFFQVVALRGATMAVVHEIGSEVVRATRSMHEQRSPVRDAFKADEKPQLRRVGKGMRGQTILRIESFMWARLWDGQPAAVSYTH